MKGEIFKSNLSLIFTLIFVISAFLFFPGSAITSSGGNFTVTPDNVSFNWTGVSINLTSNNNSVVLRVYNATTTIQPKYGQGVYGAADYPNYDASICFTNGTAFLVQNSSGIYTVFTGSLDTGNSTVFGLSAHQFCPPGYYSGKFNVTRNGTSDWANISASVNIPISTDNTFNETGSSAFVKGTLAANSKLIQKYYFNTSVVGNITGVTINLSGHTQDLDLYLFDSSGNLLTKSVNNESEREELYRDLPSPSTSEMWSMWIWGNVTTLQNYRADMYFTTLNATNRSDQNQKISSIDFGELDPETSQSNDVNITLNNVDTTVWAGVKERSEIYRVDAWNLKDQTGNYYFIVPHFAKKVKTEIRWKGGTRWFISLNDSNGNFIGNSSLKYRIGNKTDTVQQEIVIYSGAINRGNDGLWKLTVGNLSTISDDKYNVTVYVWHNASEWVGSDYPSGGFNFQPAGSANSDRNVSLKINLPSTNLTNGTYQGFIDYYKPSKWSLRVPISFNVKAGGLLINKTPESTGAVRYDNTGFNRLGTGVIKITLPLNNTGGRDVYFTTSTSDNSLKRQGDTSKYMNISVSGPSNPIQAGSSDQINISVLINTSHTANSPGTYTGWVKLLTGNSSNASSSSYPFENFTINLNVYLEGNLSVNVTQVAPALIARPSNNTNLTVNVTVKLANGTIVSTNQIINETNFIDIHLEEGNTSYTTSTTLENLTRSATSSTWSVVCPSGETHCRVNGTLRSGRPGGLYYANVGVRLNTSKMGGTGIWIYGSNRSYTSQTAVNDTGLKITDADDIDVLEGQTKVYVITLNNYGYLYADEVEVRFDEGTCPINVDQKSTNTSCADKGSGTDSDRDWEFDMNRYTTCTLAWEIQGESVSEDTDCDDVEIVFRTSHRNYGDKSIDVDVANNDTGAGDENGEDSILPPGGCTSNSSCDSDEYCKNGVCTTLSCPSGWYASSHKCKEYEKEVSITDYTSKIYLLQGGSNTTKVTVKNTGDFKVTIKLNVTSSLGGLTTEVTPSSYSPQPGNSGIFEIEFSVSNTTEVGYHKITVKAYASGETDVYATKEITLAVNPLEKTKKEINQSYDSLKILFDSIVALFTQIPPSTEANYTLANRTYTRLLNMLEDIENNIKAGNYLDAYSIMKDANASLASFRQEVEQIMGGGVLPLGNTLTLVAILVVIIVIGGFLAYLLLPPKRGYHPSIGYVPKQKVSIADKFKNLFSHVKKIKHLGRGQKTLESFERTMPVPKERPTPALPQKPPEKKPYMEGYERTPEKQYTFKKKGEEIKKKILRK